ncbi:MAG: nucleotidyltransferase domain-containing protein [Lachnospiraceae bacterium]|nr:nucleotidyltransferase domain-containing protein [Lachnospiraceae bacterium]
MRYHIPDRVLRDLTAIAEKHEVQRITLFGSRARGTHTERSDIDIMVQDGDFDGFYWDVRENVHSLLSFDVIDGNKKISDELREEIEREGVVIYEKA